MAVTWFLLVAVLQGEAASDATVAPTPHVRPASAAAHTLLTDAVARSPLVNQLIEHLATSDTFVYVEITGTPEIPYARTKLVSASPGARFLRISINARTAPWDRVPLLAHELQHAVEIADAGDVRDDEDVRRLYSKVGFGSGADQFETSAAREMEWRVRTELARRAPR